MVEVKGCPVCWGEKVVCIALDGELKPICEPCPGCDGTGWIEYKPLPEPQTEMVRDGKG